jgi:hypothetical protein
LRLCGVCMGWWLRGFVWVEWLVVTNYGIRELTARGSNLEGIMVCGACMA